jgi:predicted RNase H-like HicB family nuclease
VANPLAEYRLPFTENRPLVIVMSYDILLEKVENNGYTARVWGWPEIAVQAATREEAMERVSAALRKQLQDVEIVRLDLETAEHPLARFAGMWVDDPTFDDFVTEMKGPWARWAGVFEDDPQFDDMLAEIEAYRQELDRDKQVP